MHSMQIHKARENKRRSAAWQLTVTEELLLKMWKILFTLRHITEAVRFTQQKGNKSIGEYEKKLDPEQFFRIHKSIIINLDKVREVFPWGSNSFSLRMRGYEDQILAIARDKTRILKQHLMGL